TDKNGASKEITVNNTNRYIQGTAQAPSGITVMGGKTGTTSAAGHCLVLLSRDSSSKPYISIIMRAESGDLLYSQMTDLLEEINN
ncbi:MAG: D-alanyl-D-alanine carboxypeptidase, partial [Lachnospiraceae bacterium]|nr:D-alanyl-D-alanine carboxypeptidase [Lachnospiraceae bacterium]